MVRLSMKRQSERENMMHHDDRADGEIRTENEDERLMTSALKHGY